MTLDEPRSTGASATTLAARRVGLLPALGATCAEVSCSMRLKEIIHRVRYKRASPLDGPTRDIALVIAEPEVAAALHELYQAYGYEVFLPETPLDVIETLVMVGDQVRVVLISSEATWASGLRELIAEEFPKTDRIMLVS